MTAAARIVRMESLAGGVTLYPGDCLEVLAGQDANQVDACVTDPPYHLTSIVQRFGAEDAAPAKVGKTGAYARASAGFMGKQWDGGDIAFRVELWREVYRVLKPGAHLLAFGGTRTYHRMACAIEDAGFEIRDSIQWLYGSGFPKSHDVSKGIDRAAGAEREATLIPTKNGNAATRSDGPTDFQSGFRDISAPATDAAREWEGWGTALKPACEPIVLARKPLSEPTIAANVLRWGTGALNIDGCRVGIDEAEREIIDNRSGAGFGTGNTVGGNQGRIDGVFKSHDTGRWPANVIHDGSEEVVGAFPELGKSTGGRIGNAGGGDVQNLPVGQFAKGDPGFGDSGSAARFFYTAKADGMDRLGSRHPTVKPVDLIQYLVRLVTPRRGTVLDPFAGTGTTGEACIREGMRCVLIEREPEYQDDIRRRMRLAMAGPDERAWETAKQKNPDPDPGPLFKWGV